MEVIGPNLVDSVTLYTKFDPVTSTTKPVSHVAISWHCHIVSCTPNFLYLAKHVFIYM